MYAFWSVVAIAAFSFGFTFLVVYLIYLLFRNMVRRTIREELNRPRNGTNRSAGDMKEKNPPA
jgi:hypothetical protein